MQDVSRSTSSIQPLDGFVFARSVLDQKCDEAVELLLEAAGKTETDWLEKKASIYRSEKAEDSYRKKLETLRTSKLAPEEFKAADCFLQRELLVEIAWAIVAMHNSRGGVIFVGIDDGNQVVPLEDNDPDGILAKKGIGAYIEMGVLGRLCPNGDEKRPEGEFILKNKTVVLPVKKTGVFPKRCRYKGVEVLALLVPALERGREPLAATVTTGNSPWQTVPQRGAGDWGLVEKGNHADRWIRSASQLSDFHSDRDLRFLGRTDLSAQFREWGLTLAPIAKAEVVGVRDKEPFSSVRRPLDKPFVGRDKELEDLHALLSNGSISVVTGPGGTGKSELVFHYAARHKADYPGGMFQIGMEGIADWESAFRLMLEKPGVRDALGLPESDDAGMEGMEELKQDASLLETGDGSGMLFSTGLKGSTARKKKSVPELLSARAGGQGRILLVLDNVDPPACKTLFKATILSKLNLPAEVRILATARASDLTFPVNGACKEYKLRDFSKDVAVDFLTEAHPPTSEAERKAVERVAWMLDCRILYLEAIPALIGDDDSPFAGSWQALERGLRDDLESVVNAGMEGDEARTPAALWRQTERLFSSNRSNGARWILLARIASFFSPDHGVRKTVLSALWKRLAAPDGDPDIAFTQAANKLLKHSILMDRDGDFIMHRLTCAAILDSARKDAPELEASVGSVLAETGLSGSRDWVSLAGSIPALRHIPENLLDGRTCVDILCTNRQFEDLCPWKKLDFFDWNKLLGIHPHLIGRLKQSAEGGSAGAQTALGFCYNKGRGVEQNYEEAVKWYRKAAEQGYGPAQHNLGVDYYYGDGVEQNYEEAVKWYRKAAEQEIAIAQSALAYCYYDGRGVEQNYEEAVKWYRKAAEHGDAIAQSNLASCYYSGWGVEQNYEEAVKWYRKAAEQGHARAQFNLASCYYSGWGVEQNYEKAVKWYRKAAEQGNAIAQFSLGECHYYGRGVEQNYEEAVTWNLKAAEQGNAIAQAMLGVFYQNGCGVEQNHEEAVKWYRKAAEQGISNAQVDLGKCYYNGRGVERNVKEAYKWWHKAAEQGNAIAQSYLGYLYEIGQTVGQSYEQAVKWYCKAAEQGEPMAQLNLGAYFENGHGVKQNDQEAVKWYRKAAEQGIADAQYNLGVCYWNGRGVEQNVEEAVKWYRKAAEQGDANAQVFSGKAVLFGKGVAKNEDEAFRWFQRAENNDRAIAWLGYCFATGTGTHRDDNAAEACFAKIKDFVGGFNDIAWELFKTEKAPEALPFAEKAVVALRADETSTAPRKIMILDTLSAVLDALGRAEETKKVCAEILSLLPEGDDSNNREVALVRLGRACKRLGDKAGAADAWSKALDIVEKHGGKHAEYGESVDELRRLIREAGGAEP